MEHQNSTCRSCLVERPIIAVPVPESKFRNATSHTSHRPRLRHSELLPHLQEKQASTQEIPYVLRELPNRAPRARMKDDRRPTLTYQIWDVTQPVSLDAAWDRSASPPAGSDSAARGIPCRCRI